MIPAFLRLIRFTLALCVLLLGASCYQHLIEVFPSLRPWAVALVTGIVMAITLALLEMALRRLAQPLEAYSARQAVFLDEWPAPHLGAAIVLSSALSLFLELCVIRWQGAMFPMFAFYKNMSLLACFAGLGLGYALARKPAIPLIVTIPALLLQALVMLILRFVLGYRWLSMPVTEQLTMGIHLDQAVPQTVARFLFLATVFLLTVITFIPAGQLCGRLMSRSENLRAYGQNLLGSMVGIVLVTVLSLFWTPPVVWFAVAFMGMMPFLLVDRRTTLVTAMGSLIVLVALTWPFSPGVEQIFSPYQLLERENGERGLTSIRAAGHYYQRVHDLALNDSIHAMDPEVRRRRDYYEFPFRAHPGELARVAVVGSGTGNDVAAAVRVGCKQVDAIEIDPAILLIGRMYHPEKPYEATNVTAVVNDARIFLRQTTNRYDLIVYGLLDSHTLLSHTSGLRLDSFVYTVEGFRDARNRLRAPDSVLSLAFAVLSDELGRKIYLMMRDAFGGVPPVCVKADYDDSIIYLQNASGTLTLPPDLFQKTGFHDVTAKYADPRLRADTSTDDWPFFYMPRRVYPVSYVAVLSFVLLLSVVTVRNFFRKERFTGAPTLFFLGAAFMLVETKGITELGLTFGNTWHVISAVIFGILLMAFLANWVVDRFGLLAAVVPYLCILACLAFGWIVSWHGGLVPTPMGRVGTLCILTSPLFFSGIAFSSALRGQKDVANAMAVNLMGAMLGGLLEYNSMYFGFRSLYLLAAVLYLCAMVAHIRQRARA